MKTSKTMTKKPRDARTHPLLAIAVAAGALIAHSASADCTPGYKDSVNFNCNPPKPTPALHVIASHYTAKSNAPQNISAVRVTCPPGTHTYQGHCVVVPPRPGQAHPRTYTAHSNMPSGITPTYVSKKPPHATTPKMVDWRKTGPHIGPGPVEHHASAANTHGIIFVGGKQALNPQPIPPGHAIKRVPHPGTPIETGGH